MEHLMRCGRVTFERSTAFGFGTVRGEVSCTCTLLGPEGPDVLRPLGCGLTNLRAFSVPAMPVWGGYRPYFENYTVDASIFELIFDRFRKMILKIISQFRLTIQLM